MAIRRPLRVHVSEALSLRQALYHRYPLRFLRGVCSDTRVRPWRTTLPSPQATTASPTSTSSGTRRCPTRRTSAPSRPSSPTTPSCTPSTPSTRLASTASSSSSGRSRTARCACSSRRRRSSTSATGCTRCASPRSRSRSRRPSTSSSPPTSPTAPRASTATPRASRRPSSLAPLGAQTIEKNNKRMKGTTGLLSARRLAYERVRTLWAARGGSWLALDFEAWDRDHTMLTEFGWSLVRWGADDAQHAEQGHLIVREHRGYLNHYVPEHRDDYNFGESEEVNKMMFKERICALINEHSAAGPLFLVFHDNSQDIKYLRSPQLQAVSELEFILPDTPPSTGIFVVDTADLFAALEGEGSGNRRALHRVCSLLGITTQYLHNAGNDAHYTLLAMQSMAAGDPVDAQREKLWPNRTMSNNPKVEFQPWEDDSDYSDYDGMMPPGIPVGVPPELLDVEYRNGDAVTDADANGATNGNGDAH